MNLSVLANYFQSLTSSPLGPLTGSSLAGPVRACSDPLGHLAQGPGTSKAERRPRSLSPPPPPIAAPLLEMGFSLKHVIRGINATGKLHFISSNEQRSTYYVL